MAKVRVTTREGAHLELEAPAGQPLMEVLRDGNAGVQGICGGMCSCGTCHVYVAAAWLEKLPPKAPDEQDMLEGIGELIEVRPNSRLSCQIAAGDALDGIELEVGPVA
ncbi:MAG TPA: 2Fe-2S iron-sulfur cluster-binding protein [Candidatus Binatia bacterium]|nr:2Fe-2S iron-sulfur cluster-binding protein [Candidatus Binatia bacterium]